jgi:hypothetical protein
MRKIALELSYIHFAREVIRTPPYAVVPFGVEIFGARRHRSAMTS